MNKINIKEYSKTISLMDLKIKMIDEHVRSSQAIMLITKNIEFIEKFLQR